MIIEGILKVKSWLRKERERLNVSQKYIANKLQINQVLLSNYELGKGKLEPKIIDEIRKILADIEKNGNGFKKKIITYSPKTFKRKIPTPPYQKFKDIKKVSIQRLKEFEISKSYYNNDELKTIDLFAGCGGLSVGFEEAGYKSVGFIELESWARSTYQRNFKDSLCLEKDITKITEKEIEQWKKTFGKIHAIIGGPPCQGFSLAGKRDIDDPRNNLFRYYLDIVKIIQPNIVLLENVKLLLTMKNSMGKLITGDIINGFNNVGYNCKFRVLDAKNYGVPQNRERVVFIGIRKDLDIIGDVFPDPTHCSKSELNSLFNRHCSPYITFRDATKDLEKLESGEWSEKDIYHWAVSHPPHVINWLKDVSEGHSAHENANPNLRPPSGYNTTYKRIYWDEPCSTIGTTFAMISGSNNVHPQETRSLTIKEAMRCQTFPDTFKFSGTWGNIRKMIGNAVPPKLAENIALHLKKYAKK